MKWLMLVVLFHLLLTCSKCNKVINITSQDHLLQLYLCHHYNYTSDTTLLLLDNIYNISGNGSLCTINTHYSLTIQGNHSMATIQCISSAYANSIHPTIGFAFTGSSSLTLQRVTFIGCGANLATLDKEQLDIINSTSSLVYFTQYHAAVLVFTEISHLVMRDVNISQYYGFAIVAVNLHNGTLDSVDITSSRGIERVPMHKNVYSVGCGVILLYGNSLKTFTQNIVVIAMSHFERNYDLIYYPHFTCIKDFYNSFTYQVSRNPIINAAGLTILYTQNDTRAQVNISRCTFKGNIGSIAVALLVLHLNTITNSQTFIHNNSIFDTNGSVGKCYASAIVFIMYFDQVSQPSHTNMSYHPLQLSNVIIKYANNSLLNSNQQCVMYVLFINANKLYIRFELNYVIFDKNKAMTVYVAARPQKINKINMIMKSVEVCHNNIPERYSMSSIVYPRVSLFQLFDINKVRIYGSTKNPSKFSFNHGTVIKAVRCDIVLHGHVLFHNNTGIDGAAITLIEGFIHLTQGLRANFINNHALSKGGAIYIFSNTFEENYCTFQVNLYHYDNIKVLFKNNRATVSGNSVYSSNLYYCYMGKHFVNSTMASDIYNTIFTFLPNDAYELSTTPVNLTICDSPHNVLPYIYDAYPGQTITFSMAAINTVGHHSYSIVTITSVKATDVGFMPIKWWFSESDNVRVITETDECTLVNVAIHTNDTDTLNMCSHYGSLLFTIPSVITTTVVGIKLKSCPPGFELNTVRGSCVCSNVISSLNINGYTPNCRINTRTFNRPTFTSWVGTINETSGFLLCLYCFHGYCNGDIDFTVFQYNNRDKKFKILSKDLSINSSLCLYNREGILCGNCSTNYSVVFGSTECRQCSNWWLWTLVLYAVAGPLLIYLLFALKLTLTTGTFNGIIFYAQAANVGILDMLSVYNGKMGVVRRISIVLLSVLNLGLGFPLCFYNGMTELWKAGLSLLFPLYLLTIIVVLIILSRFSLRLSNRLTHSSVQVLVTVVHLSFGKLLGAIINAFTPVKVFTSDQIYHVWYWDGSVEYGSKGHIILIVITSLIVFLLLLPYVLLLLFAKPLRHFTFVNEYTRPILEAIHAPYKNDKQYWFVARLLLLIVMYILYSIEPYEYFIYTAIASMLFFFIIGQAIYRPFKNKLINLLDCWLLFNLFFIYITTKHFDIKVYNIVAIFLFFVTFFIIMVFHILFITGQLKKAKIKFNTIFTRVIENNQDHTNQRSRHLPLQDSNDSFYGSCDNYREGILNSAY